MSTFAPPVQKLVTELSKLPGIGNRTAQRLAFHILRVSGEDATALAQAILEVKERIGLCEVCFNLADEPRCRICRDPRRDQGVICVVEEPSDVIPMERTHEFEGVYHVLGGALSPIDGVDPEDLKIAELYARVAGGTIPPDGPRSPEDPTSLPEPVLHGDRGARRSGPRDRARHQPDHHRRGDGAAHRTRPARARPRAAGHPPGERSAGGV